MSRTPTPVFLERRSYRRRRLRDAALIVPVLGALLLLMPLLWAPGPGEGADTGRGLIYVFGVWAGLILAAAWLARPLTAPTDPDASARAGGDDGPGWDG